MSGFEAWIADCYVRDSNGDGEKQGQAAVWIDSAEGFRAALTPYLEAQGLKILWIEECLQASEYLARHPKEQKRIGQLARSVHPHNRVELSKLSDRQNEEEAPESYLTITEHEIPPLPDQSKIPFWDQEWIAPELKELLFGQKEGEPKLNTYFIVDATLRKNITGVFDLDALDVPVQCLFKGDAAEDLKENAPYLIDATLPDGAYDNRDLVPHFQRDFFKKHWSQNTGIFIRTTAKMQDVWAHFRKFPRIQVEEDKRWIFFRYWDPRTITAFVEALDEDDMHKFLGSHQLIKVDEMTLKSYHATNQIGENQRRALPPLTMKNEYINAFKKDRQKKFKEKLVQFISEEAPAFEKLETERRVSVVDNILEEAMKHGIKIERAVANFALASILFGKHLIKDPQFERIIKSNKHQNDIASELINQVRFRLSPTKKD